MSPMKVFEYMAAKIPFICSDVQRIREVCGDDSCYYFQPDDFKDLSKTIKQVLNLSQKVKDVISTNAYGKVKEFTYVKRCQKILK